MSVYYPVNPKLQPPILFCQINCKAIEEKPTFLYTVERFHNFTYDLKQAYLQSFVNDFDGIIIISICN